MFKFLVRCVMFIAGIAIILDITLPIRTERLQVDQHTSQTQVDHRPISGGDSRWADTHYKIQLIGGVVSSCSVGYSTYGKLRDGDTIEVKSTKLLKNCIAIARGEELLESDKYWRILAILLGGLLVAGAVGWLKGNDSDGDGDGVTIRIGLG